MADGKESTADERVNRALEANVPHIYFNGFANAFSPGDIMVILEKNGQPVGVLNMSYTIAKTLSVGLGQLITTLEEGSEQPVMTSQEVQKFLEGSSQTQKEKGGK